MSHASRSADLNEPAEPAQVEMTAEEMMAEIARLRELTSKPARAPKSAGPGPNERKRIVAQVLIDVAAELATQWDDPRVSREEAAELLASYCSYAPGSYWRDELPEPTTGRGKRHARSADDAEPAQDAESAQDAEPADDAEPES